LDHGSVLPGGFESLECFVPEWVLEDTGARSAKRQQSSIAQLRRFYDGMLPLAAKALDHLKTVSLGAMPEDSARLLKLMLSLAEIAPAVEWYDGPKVYDGFEMNRMRLIRFIPDTAAQ